MIESRMNLDDPEDSNRSHSGPLTPVPSPRRWGRSGARRLLTLFFPRCCLVCGCVIDDGGAICPDCWGQFNFIAAPLCARCGYPFPHPVADGAICGACTREAPPYASARAVLVYDAASRDLVLSFKYADRTRYAVAFGTWLHRAGKPALARADVIAPVPLHRLRLLRRRYNQSLLLARALSRASGCPLIPDLLVRTRNTPTQGRLSRSARRRNVRRAFAIRKAAAAAVVGKSILLVDDVLTTGATVEACTRILLDGGVSEVHVLTLARVVRVG